MLVKSEDECEDEERDYRLYNISNCMDCMVDEESYLVLTLVARDGWQR
jgi:hypothetical protein